MFCEIVAWREKSKFPAGWGGLLGPVNMVGDWTTFERDSNLPCQAKNISQSECSCLIGVDELKGCINGALFACWGIFNQTFSELFILYTTIYAALKFL